MGSSPRTPALPFLALLAACATSGFEAARKEDTAESYRRFLRDEKSHPHAQAAWERLAEIEFDKARRVGTPLAYKRFLEEFPESPRREAARVLLEGLRFEAAREKDVSSGWSDFLRDHPHGTHSVEARKQLEAADYREATQAPSANAIEVFLARHPDSTRRMEAERLLDDRRYAEARAKGPRAVMEYLDLKDAGAHRDEARGELKAREVLARAALGDFEGAYREAQQVASDAGRTTAAAEVERAELEDCSARLDPEALEAFARRRSGPAAEEARSRARALNQDRKAAAALKALVARLDPLRYARPEEELVRVLEAEDPRERWIAAYELGRLGSRRAVDPLLSAAALSRFSRVRHRAFEALKEIFALLPPETLEIEVRRRAEGLRRVATGQALAVKLAMLDELLGDDRAAAEGYARSLRGGGGDLFVLRRLAHVRSRRGEGFRSAVSARELATEVIALVKQRDGEEKGLSPLLLSRTLCGARDDAAAAAALLSSVPKSVADDFPEDLSAFQSRAEEAMRLSSARLSDAEAGAREARPGFKGCDDPGEAAARLTDGENDRLQAVSELAARRDPRSRPALSRVAQRDPSAKVREAARAALGLLTAEVRGR